MSAEREGKDELFVSSLGEGRAAFLAELSEYSLQLGERSPADFLRHFSCTEIIQALKGHERERSRLLVEATGTHEKIAPRMSSEAAGETLQIALDEGITTPAQIVGLFAPDDRQRTLDSAGLWAFTVEGEPWSKSRKGSDLERSKKFMRRLLERALHHKLLDQKELVSSLSVARLTTLLPPSLLAAIIEASLAAENKFSHADLVEVAPPDKLVDHVPLDYVWEKVVVPLIAERHAFTKGGGESSEPVGQPQQSSAAGDGSPTVEAAPAEDSDELSEALEGKLDEADYAEALEAATEVVEAERISEDDDEEDVVLDDDEEEVHTVTDEDDVFDDLLEDGLSDPDATQGPGVKRTSGEPPKKNANAH